jgi:hypothetical protein
MKTKNVLPPSVADYFEQKLGAKLPPAHPGETELDREHPASPAHPEFHIETGCGEDCKLVIDTACELLAFLRAYPLINRAASRATAQELLDLLCDAIGDQYLIDRALAVIAVTYSEAELTLKTVQDVHLIAAEVVNCYVYG